MEERWTSRAHLTGAIGMAREQGGIAKFPIFVNYHDKGAVGSTCMEGGCPRFDASMH